MCNTCEEKLAANSHSAVDLPTKVKVQKHPQKS